MLLTVIARLIRRRDILVVLCDMRRPLIHLHHSGFLLVLNLTVLHDNPTLDILATILLLKIISLILSFLSWLISLLIVLIVNVFTAWWFLVLKHLQQFLLLVVEGVLGAIHGRLLGAGHLRVLLFDLRFGLVDDLGRVGHCQHFGLAFIAQPFEFNAIAAVTGRGWDLMERAWHDVVLVIFLLVDNNALISLRLLWTCIYLSDCLNVRV